jgi:putative hydrolase of HD superfamily
MTPERIAALIDFLQVADRLKHVERRGQTVGPDGAARQENSAEHCWNVALVAVLLHAEMPEPPDLGHVLAMIAAHDLVEVEAGDTFAYDQVHILTQAARERAAADVVFGRLPTDLGQKLRGLWEEFEAGETPEARFAMACDRAQGFLQTSRADRARHVRSRGHAAFVAALAGVNPVMDKARTRARAGTFLMLPRLVG